MSKDFAMRVGSKRQVWNGTAEKTSGGIKKSGLIQNDRGEIKYKAMSKAAKKNKNLEKAGWTYQKGKFGAVRDEDVRRSKKSLVASKAKKQYKKKSKTRSKSKTFLSKFF